jgi:hypothetical protein
LATESHGTHGIFSTQSMFFRVLPWPFAKF